MIALQMASVRTWDLRALPFYLFTIEFEVPLSCALKLDTKSAEDFVPSSAATRTFQAFQWGPWI